VSKQREREQINAVADAERVVAELEAKRTACAARAVELGEERKRISFAALGELAKSAGSRSPEERKSRGRSRLTNGNGPVLPDVDGRSLIARRYRDIAAAILVDQGGADHCSESRKQLIRRFAAAAVLAEQMESRLARGEQIDIAEHATLSSTLVKLAQRIGIDRLPQDITPDPLDYAQEREPA